MTEEGEERRGGVCRGTEKHPIAWKDVCDGLCPKSTMINDHSQAKNEEKETGTRAEGSGVIGEDAWTINWNTAVRAHLSFVS